MYKKLAVILSFILILSGLLVEPVSAAATISTTPASGTYLSPNTAQNYVSTVGNTFGTTKTVFLWVETPTGIYFNGSTTVNSGTITCTDYTLHKRACSVSIPASSNRVFTTPLITGEGFATAGGCCGGATAYFWVEIDSVSYAQDDRVINKNAGYVPMLWDARWAQTPDVHYTHGTSTYEYTFFDATFATTPRTGKFTFFIQNGEVTNIGLCKWNHATDTCTTGWLGSAGWVDGTHQGAYINYSGMDNSDYALLVNFDTPPSAGSSYLQVVYTSFVGATGYRATDVRDTVVID